MRCHVIDKKDVFKSGHRFDAGFHLSNGVTIRRNLLSLPYPSITISDVTSRIHYGIRANRRYVTKREHAIPFMTGANIMLSDINNTKLISKKYAPCVDEMTLHKNWVLITRSGTVGQTAWSNNLFEGKYGSEDIIRVIPNNKIKGGCVYAYLASKYGQSLLTQGSFGAVIQHIEPTFVGNLPIPDFPEDFQNRVDLLVQESAKLREEASEALEEAVEKLNCYINPVYNKSRGFKHNSVKASIIRKSIIARLDPIVYINDGIDTIKSISKNTIKLGECNVKFWYPGIFKRAYVSDGLPYLQGSAIFDRNPFRKCDYLSRTRTPMLGQLWLTKGLILITCAGACGQVKLITQEYEDKKAIGSPDIIRLQSKDDLYTAEYLFTYLQLPFVYEYMQSLKYGSVIERFDIEHVKTIPVVEPTMELSSEITTIIREYMDCTYRAFNAEEEAITMVEQEIEKWNK